MKRSERSRWPEYATMFSARSMCHGTAPRPRVPRSPAQTPRRSRAAGYKASTLVTYASYAAPRALAFAPPLKRTESPPL
jgi:hypothetical protein